MAWEKTKEQKALEEAMMARLIKRGLAKNRDPKEELSRNCRRYLELKSRIDLLQAEYNAINSYLKQTITQRGETIMVDDLKDDNIGYTIVIKNGSRTTLNTTRARALLTDEQIASCSDTTQTESLTIKEVAKIAA